MSQPLKRFLEGNENDTVGDYVEGYGVGQFGNSDLEALPISWIKDGQVNNI